MGLWPGPASSVEEHSLRKIRSQGDRGSNLAEEFYFFRRDLLSFAKMFGGKFSTYRTCYIKSRNLRSEAVATLYY